MFFVKASAIPKRYIQLPIQNGRGKTVEKPVYKRIVVLLLACMAIYSVVNPDISYADENQAVILMYHHFGVSKYPTTNIQLAQFDAQLDYIAQNNIQVWPLSRVVQYIKNKQTFPGRVVAITVDDAYLSVYTEAFPRLRKRNWPFTVFVATDGVDRHFKSYMSWEHMREMQRHDVTFANHSASHDYLVQHHKDETPEQWKTRVTRDIQRAQSRLQSELGEAPMLFAYPYGEYNTELAKILDSMNFVAFGQHSGPAGTYGDLLALPRFPMAEKFAAIKDFVEKINSLAFPVNKQDPWEPTLSASANPPLLKLALGKSDAHLDQLRCFVSGQGRTNITWINKDERTFSIQAKSPLSEGRSRYNCTAPSDQKGRYYWFSHLWINPFTDKPFSYNQ